MALVHSTYGGSGASRWLNCAGSVALIGQVGEKPRSTAAADEGTLAHEFAAYMLANGERNIVDSYVGATLDAQVGSQPLTEGMARAIQHYLDAVWAEYDKTPDAEIYVEKRVDLEIEGAAGEVGTTIDCWVYHRSTGRLVVFDYKHGVGVAVEAENNDQVKFGATCVAFAFDQPISEVEGVIVQPRSWENTEPVRRWPFDKLELLDFKAQCEAAIRRSKLYLEASSVHPLKDPDSYEIGPWCRWCDAQPFCPAKQAEAVQAFGNVNLELPGTPEMPDPDVLIDERLAQIVAAIGYLNDYAARCQELLEARLLAGHTVPGWKVVDKIGRAKWVADEEEVAAYLNMLFDIPEDLIRPRKLTTIGDVEKLMKANGATKTEIDTFKLKHTLKESSGLTIAPESDRRPAVNAAERAFGGVNIDT